MAGMMRRKCSPKTQRDQPTKSEGKAAEIDRKRGMCREEEGGGRKKRTGGELLMIVVAKGGVVLQIVRDVTGRRFVGDEDKCGVGCVEAECERRRDRRFVIADMKAT